MLENASGNFTRPKRSWIRILLISLAVVAGLLVLLFFISSFVLSYYLHSDAFRIFLNKKTSTFFRAEGQYQPVHWSGFSFYSDGFEAQGQPDSLLARLRADQIRAEFYPRGIFHRAWQINNLEIQRLRVGFGWGALTANPQPSPAPEMPPAQPAGSSWLPDRLEILRVQIEQTDLNWMLSGKEGGLRGSRVKMEPDGKAWLADATGGELYQGGYPALGIDHLKIRYQHPDLFINDALLKLGDSENLSLAGQVSLEGERPLDLRADISGVDITPFLPEDWRAKLHGIAAGQVSVKGVLQNPQSIQASGTLNLTNGQIEALPVLNKIATFTRTVQFRKIVLQKAEADFVWTVSNLNGSRLLLESQGLIRVEGSFVVQQGNMNGLFQVGVTPASLRWLPGSQERVFTQERAGFVWTAVRVSGPLISLHEDLSPRLVAAAKDQILDDVQGNVEQGARGVIDLLKSITP